MIIMYTEGLKLLLKIYMESKLQDLNLTTLLNTNAIDTLQSLLSIDEIIERYNINKSNRIDTYESKLIQFLYCYVLLYEEQEYDLVLEIL